MQTRQTPTTTVTTTAVYHCAPTSARDSITSHGIDPDRSTYRRSTDTLGFYAFTDLDEARHYATEMANASPRERFDIWEVEIPTAGMTIDTDLHPGLDEPTSAVHVPTTTAAHHVTLATTIEPRR